MKSAVISFVLTLPLLAFSAENTCGSEVLTWPLDVNNNCAEQMFANGGAKVGTKFLAIDGVNAGSEAVFECTANGWKYLSGNCTVKHNYECIAQTLQSIDSDLFIAPTPELINDYLDVPGYGGRQMVVDATNKCDAGN